MDVEACDMQLGAALQARDPAGLVAALTASLRQKSNAFPVLRQTLRQLLLQVRPAVGRAAGEKKRELDDGVSKTAQPAAGSRD